MTRAEQDSNELTYVRHFLQKVAMDMESEVSERPDVLCTTKDGKTIVGVEITVLADRENVAERRAATRWLTRNLRATLQQQKLRATVDICFDHIEPVPKKSRQQILNDLISHVASAVQTLPVGGHITLQASQINQPVPAINWMRIRRGRCCSKPAVNAGSVFEHSGGSEAFGLIHSTITRKEKNASAYRERVEAAAASLGVDSTELWLIIVVGSSGLGTISIEDCIVNNSVVSTELFDRVGVLDACSGQAAFLASQQAETR